MPRSHRQAHNQALFRAVNENIATLATRFEAETQAYFCECSQAGCTQMLDVPAPIYDRVRSDPSHYLIRADHQDATQEVIVEDFGDYLIVQVQPVVVTAAPVSPITVSQS